MFFMYLLLKILMYVVMILFILVANSSVKILQLWNLNDVASLSFPLELQLSCPFTVPVTYHSINVFNLLAQGLGAFGPADQIF